MIEPVVKKPLELCGSHLEGGLVFRRFHSLEFRREHSTKRNATESRITRRALQDFYLNL